MEEIMDKMIGRCTGAAILSKEGIIWYSIPGFYTDPVEFKRFSNVFDENSNVIYDGVTFQNQVYLTLSLRNDVFVGTTNTSCIVMCKCRDCIIFAYEENKTSYEKLKNAVKEVSDELMNEEIYKEFI